MSDLAQRIIEMLRDAAKDNEYIPVEYAERSPMRHECIGRLAAWQEALFRAEVLEREAGQTSASAATDADIAREFFRRFGPVKVLVGAWGEGRLAYAEEDGGEWLSGVSSGDPQTEEHATGEDGFVAALERARALVKGGA